MLSLYLKLKKLYNMKEKLTTTFLSAWTLGILIIVITAMTSCSTTHGVKTGNGSNDGASWGLESRCGK